jgi:hypothetical protein
VHRKNGGELEELTRDAMGQVVGGDAAAPTSDCDPNLAPCGIVWLLGAATRLFNYIRDTAPAANYAYGKVGYSG